MDYGKKGIAKGTIRSEWDKINGKAAPPVRHQVLELLSCKKWRTFAEIAKRLRIRESLAMNSIEKLRYFHGIKISKKKIRNTENNNRWNHAFRVARPGDSVMKRGGKQCIVTKPYNNVSTAQSVRHPPII